jgi:PTH1 family peptidyl-tRNA hydrolase
VPLEAAIEAVKAVPPFPGRMSPEELSTGVILIRDDWKAPLLSFPPALEFMRQAQGLRKIVIIGTISDYSGASKGKYVQIARQSRAVSDYVFFVGPWAPHCLPARTQADDASLQVFATVHQLAEYLRTFLRQGDLVLLKGSPKDHLQSIITLLNSRGTQTAGSARTVDTTPLPTKALARHLPQLVIGLGNPQEEYENTRHNIGQRVVDVVAARLGVNWKQEDQAMIARTEVHGRPVCLVKLLTSMNTSGAALRQLGERLEVGVPECLLVYDDMDLPVGKVRERMRGSAGGHKGVLSIITTYQSEEFRRVKIGVGQPPDRKRAAVFALSVFSASEEAAIRDAVADACSRVLRLLAEYRAGPSTVD